MSQNHALPILYSFRRCPYAIRARMAIKQACVKVQLREVVLRNKPQALIDASAKATVPVLAPVNESVIDESLAIMHWAMSQSDPDGWLPVSDQAAARTSALIEKNDHEFKPWLDRYKYADRHPERSADDYRAEGERFIRQLESVLSTQATLHGGMIGLADVAIFPFVRQFAHVDLNWFMNTPYPAVQQWYQRWVDRPLFTEVMEKYPPWETGQTVTLFPDSVASGAVQAQA